MTHNFAIARQPTGDGWVGVGGQFRPRVTRGIGDTSPRADTGVFSSFTVGRTWCFMRPCTTPHEPPGDESMQQWQMPVKLFDGKHDGCIERVHGGTIPTDKRWLMRSARDGQGEYCEFDGRLSLAWHRGRWLLYVRANIARGIRAVQLTISSDLRTWSPFRIVRTHGLSLRNLRPGARGGAYFFGVQPNPLHNHSLIAIFPVVLNGEGSIAIAASYDGFHWSHPTTLLRCDVDVYKERATTNPAFGFVLDGGKLHFWVHEHVGWVVPRTYFHGGSPRPQLVRYAIDARRFEWWTQSALNNIASKASASQHRPRQSALNEATESLPVPPVVDLRNMQQGPRPRPLVLRTHD